MPVAPAGLAFRLARDTDSVLVQKISAAAYVPVYQAVVGVVPRPAIEDYGDAIAHGHVWLALLDEMPCAVLVVEPQPAYLLVYSVAVHPDFQGKGLGKALLAHAEEIAVNANMYELRLYTNARMDRNIGLYRSVGFLEIDRRPHPSHKGEILIDMAKRIGL